MRWSLSLVLSLVPRFAAMRRCTGWDDASSTRQASHVRGEGKGTDSTLDKIQRPLGTGRCRRAQQMRVRSARKKNQQEREFPNINMSGKKPGEMSRQTDHRFKFKYERQMFSFTPSTRPCHQYLPVCYCTGRLQQLLPPYKIRPRISQPHNAREVVVVCGLLSDSSIGRSCLICV